MEWIEGRWMWLVMLVMGMAVLWPSCGGQKVEVDGLAEDTYNTNNADKMDDSHKSKSGEKAELRYVVTEEVYFDIRVANRTDKEKPFQGRVVIACFGEITPITCLNFVALAKGHRKGKDLLTYKGTPVHRVVRDFVIQMGDVTGTSGTSGKSIYGKTFEDENFTLSHRGAGWVAMANYGKDTNGSQFFVLLQPARWLDGRHVVFGKVIKGMDIIRRIGELQTSVTRRPIANVTIEDCGPVGIAAKYEIPTSDVFSNNDISS